MILSIERRNVEKSPHSLNTIILVVGTSIMVGDQNTISPQTFAIGQ